MDQEFWQPFYARFKSGENSLFDDYFFPFGLIKDSNLKKSDVYSHLRKIWKDQGNPSLIIQDLASFQDAFLDLCNRTNNQNQTKKVAIAVERISRITPTSTFPFLLRLLNSLKSGVVNEDEGIKILALLESFLVRRAVCGHEPTGLHSVFKKLWDDCEQNPTAQLVEAKIRERKTVVWPTTSDVRACVRSRPLYGSSITNFLLIELNRSLGGDQPGGDPWVEHVLPATLSEDWKKKFTEAQHEEQKDRLANLLPLSRPMNQALGNGSYTEKRAVYLEDSYFKAAREFAKENLDWTPEALENRSKAIADWIIDRWPS